MTQLYPTVWHWLKYACLIIMAIETKVNCVDFNPNVMSRCINGAMSIGVQALDAFYGVVYVEGHREQCFVQGNGEKRIDMDISLTDIDRCGIDYDQESEQYSVMVNVRQHKKIILEQDKLFNLSCSLNPNQTTTSPTENKDNSPSLNLGFFQEDSGQHVHQVLFGDQYQLRLWSTSKDSGEHFVITGCTGFANENFSLPLTDYDGCSRDTKIISNFFYNNSTKTATATIKSMFKIPRNNRIHVQCAVIFCSNQCPPKTDCERRKDSAETNSNKRSEKQILQPVQRFASSTILVSDFGNKSAAAVRVQRECGQHYETLVSLCVLFGVLLLVAMVVNLTFCALSGHCCCRLQKAAVAKQPFSLPIAHGWTYPISTAAVEYQQQQHKIWNSPYHAATIGRAQQLHNYATQTYLSNESNCDSQNQLLQRRQLSNNGHIKA